MPTPDAPTPVRFAALGDSITVGLGDPMPDGTWRGWAALLADGLAPPDPAGPSGVEFHNLAHTGALTADVLRDQLPAALDLRPTVAAVIVGVNDTLRARFDVSAIGAALLGTIGALRRTGALVLTARLPEPGRMLGLPSGLARPLARRIAAVNAVTDHAAALHGTVHFDIANHPDTYRRDMWSVDRLHPSERGHRLLASAYADLLRERGVPVHHHPDPRPGNPPPTRAAQLTWLAVKGTRWVRDRCTDLLPQLVWLAAAESWYTLRGEARRLDDRLGRDLAAALAACTPDPTGEADPAGRFGPHAAR
ncbi:SGNH/GDSL hydrolase family protein [Micromonospora sp. WMMA1363]|uniref:SGNH/GDSL hydrolase family protein n=1 Tax=Micromonospora sp. WMMA1363 TaxID=3053985 RepID=UPI00259CBF64|nr:SGNH/GDSL hydrolase family protein [Micromonospora sp. WMMA1363]MDM4718953.1 SGNH/GDSL hydrolase family protein [Micromonospora sp. WMMA1363]